MRASPGRIATVLLAALALAPIAARPAGAQQVTPASAEAQPQPRLSKPALDQLLAPIALYPDTLLGQILMAAAYPLEIVMADRWTRDPRHAALKGDRLAAALAPIDWDPSVKALVPFPQILAMMDQRIDWTRKLGDAFIAQQGDVMDAVQRLRRRAAAAGSLRSTPQQTVTPVGPDYVIQPVSPTVVYVPVYDPALVYGAWPYPLYPPYALVLPPGFYVGPPVVREVRFSSGFIIVHRFWGWDDCDWRHRRLRIDRHHYEAIDRHFIRRDRHVHIADDRWRPSEHHRRLAAAARTDAPHRPPPQASAPRRTFGHDVGRSGHDAGKPAPTAWARPEPRADREPQHPSAGDHRTERAAPAHRPTRQEAPHEAKPPMAAPAARAAEQMRHRPAVDPRRERRLGREAHVRPTPHPPRIAAPRPATPRAEAPPLAAPHVAPPHPARPHVAPRDDHRFANRWQPPAHAHRPAPAHIAPAAPRRMPAAAHRRALDPAGDRHHH
jgi:hypothetical protein